MAATLSLAMLVSLWLKHGEPKELAKQLGALLFCANSKEIGLCSRKTFAFLDGGKGLAYVGSAMQLPTHFDNLERRLHGDRLH